MINDTGRLMLSYLFEQDNDFISCQKLANLCKLSTGTIRNEIGLLNDHLQTYGIHIDARQSQGFKLIANNPELETQSFENFKYDLKRKLFNTNSKTYNSNYIIRRLLISSSYLPQDKLCNELFVSPSSLRRSIVRVQKSLDRYNLTIELKRNHGYCILGDEFNKRIYLLIQHKKSMHLDPEKKLLEEKFFAYFLTGSGHYKKFKDVLYETLADFPKLEFSFINTPKLVNYLIICKQRYMYSENIHFTTEQLAIIHADIAYVFANEIFVRLKDLLDFIPTDNDISSFARLVIGYRTLSTLDQIPEAERASSLDKWSNILNAVIKEENLSPSLFSTEFYEQFACNMKTIKNKSIMETPFDLETLSPVSNTASITADLCCTLEKVLIDKMNFSIDQSYIKSNICLFERIIESANKNSLELKVLVISMYGTEYARNIALYILRKFHRFIHSIDTAEFFNRSISDYNYYDLILTDLSLASLFVSDHVFYIDFSSKTIIRAGFNGILNNRIKTVLENLIDHNIYSVSLKNKKEVFNFIANVHKEHIRSKDKFIADLTIRDNHFSSVRVNNMAFISTYDETLPESTLDIIINNRQIEWNGSDVKYFIFYYRDRKIQKNIHTFDLILNNLVNKTAEEIDELFSSKDNIIELLAPKKFL